MSFRVCVIQKANANTDANFFCRGRGYFLAGSGRSPKTRPDGARMAEACDSPKGTPQDVGDKEDGMKKSERVRVRKVSDELTMIGHDFSRFP